LFWRAWRVAIVAPTATETAHGGLPLIFTLAQYSFLLLAVLLAIESGQEIVKKLAKNREFPANTEWSLRTRVS